jgi:hypothetical protein
MESTTKQDPTVFIYPNSQLYAREQPTSRKQVPNITHAISGRISLLKRRRHAGQAVSPWRMTRAVAASEPNAETFPAIEWLVVAHFLVQRPVHCSARAKELGSCDRVSRPLRKVGWKSGLCETLIAMTSVGQPYRE